MYSTSKVIITTQVVLGKIEDLGLKRYMLGAAVAHQKSVTKTYKNRRTPPLPA
jgi:hypothetical protein